MRAAPRGESASRSELRAPIRPIRAPTRTGKLRKPQQFAALAGDLATWRASRQWVAAAARVVPRPGEPGSEGAIYETGDIVEHPTSSVGSESATPGLRFGFTVARRQARRAVQRAMVKRLFREAARALAPELRAASRGQIDLVLRLRTPLPDRSHMTLSQLKRALRAEADSLIAQFARHLRAGTR
jgi:ribonuclease P protein component